MREYLILCYLFCQFQSVHARADDSPVFRAAEIFSKNIAEQISQLLYDAGAVKKETQTEDVSLNKRMTEIHRDLDKWFRSKGKHITWERCESNEDKTNYLEFRQSMANRDFLQLELNLRLQYIRKMNQYFAHFSSKFSTSLIGILNSGTGYDKTSEKLVVEKITGQLNKPVEIQIRFFNRNKFTMTGAVYLPKVPMIYFNLNEMIRSGPDFIDSFEHELWHHLLPPRDKSGDFITLWFEGFTETVSEIWSESLNKNDELAGNTLLLPAKTIQYPIQTAFVSLFFGIDKRLALSYFSGAMSIENLRSFLCFNESEFDPSRSTQSSASLKYATTMRERFCEALLTAKTISRFDQNKIEKILSDWGWKEDDGKNISISRYLDDELISDKSVNTAYRREKQFFLDFVQALTIVQLQKIRKDVPIRKMVGMLQLPGHLIKNIKKVVNYVNYPYHQYANR